MPHFGLMDESTMPPEEAALLRAKLHIRCGMRRMRQGKSAAGLATIYDAILSAMRWHILTTPLKGKLGNDVEEQLENERVVFSLMRKAGILDGALDWNRFQALVDQALMEEEIIVDREALLGQVEELMTRLGVMPFDESILPPEDPRTF